MRLEGDVTLHVDGSKESHDLDTTPRVAVAWFLPRPGDFRSIGAQYYFSATSLTEALSAVRANGGIPLTKRSSHIAGAPKVATRLEAIFAGTVVSAASGHGVYEAGVAIGEGVAFRPGKIAMYLNISDPTLEHDLCMCILSIDFHVQDPLTGGHHFRVDALCSIPGFD